MRFDSLFVVAAFALSSVGAALGQQPDPQEMLKKMAPGEMHKVLVPMVGKFNGVTKMWMDPKAEPMTSTSKSEAKWVMGGRYVETKVGGDFMGMPFEGVGVYGYDNLAKKFVASWIDNMGTGIMTMDGVYDASAKTLTWTSEMIDPMTEKKCKTREVDKFIDNDNWTMTMYKIGDDGKEIKMMEIHLKRDKG